MSENEEKTGSAENSKEIENKEKIEKEPEVVIPVTIGTAAMNSVDATKAKEDADEDKTYDGDDNGEEKNRRLRNSVIRMAVALVAALILLAVTGFSQIKLIKGPVESEDIQSNEIGDFVTRDVYAILGFYADEKNSKDETISRYAVVPMNGKLVSVHFTERYLDAANSVCNSTYDFVQGKVSSLDAYVTVEGTVGMLDEKASALLYDWFGVNKDQLVEMKMIADTDDYSTYLSDYVLRVDTINGHSETLSVVLGILAGIFVLWAIVEIILMATGSFLPKIEGEEEESTVLASDNDDASSDEDGEKTDGEEKDSKEADDNVEVKDEKEPEENEVKSDEPEDKE